MNSITIEDFLIFNKEIPMVDVRSPMEFEQGHIPDAINIPLFDNSERVTIGTLYKNSGQKEAILIGLDIAGKKMRALAELGLKTAKNKELLIHCWRGGMRSASMAWLFETCGIRCRVLNGGYKSYRNHIRKCFSLPENLLVIGGMTGSGKSDILVELENHSFQVLKLERIANHKGSAFGNLGELPQKSNEQFENDVFTALSKFDMKQPIFVEDESRNIGRNIIPLEFFLKMSGSRQILIEMDKELRIKRLVDDYGKFSSQELKECILKISKRLGGQNTQAAIDFLENGKLEEAAEISLRYYDKTYNFGLLRKVKNETIKIHLDNPEAKSNTSQILLTLKNSGLI
jgi:tRNA 2-selenouridine synthase